jgi:type IV pilus assembly protein PilO
VPKFSLATLPWKAQLAMFIGLSLASAGAFYYFYEMPLQARLAESEQQLTTVRARINKGLTTARQLPEFRKEVAELQARLDSLKPILPDEKDAADLLRRVNTLAVQSNLTIRSFRPQPIATRTMHAEWPITLQLEGSYHNLGLFLDRVSKFPRIINVGALDIRGKDDTTANNTIDVTCTATTFVLIEAQPAADTAKKKKGAASAKKTE